jgi:tellurite resistance protein TerB
MGFLDNLRNQATSASAGLQTKVARFNNAKFLKGTIAACALIINADGKVLDDELDGAAEFINSYPLLSCFRPDEKMALTSDFLQKAGNSMQKIELLGYVSALKGDNEAASTCIELAVELANSDGEFAPEEKKMVQRLCRSLGLDAGIYID